MISALKTLFCFQFLLIKALQTDMNFFGATDDNTSNTATLQSGCYS